MYAGKKSNVHSAAVVGDTVGDPLKDTSGPALNIVMKLMAIISVCAFVCLYVGHACVYCLEIKVGGEGGGLLSGVVHTGVRIHLC